MPVETELYDLLGVPPSATESEFHTPFHMAPFSPVAPLDDIKKAYRKKVSGPTDVEQCVT